MARELRSAKELSTVRGGAERYAHRHGDVHIFVDSSTNESPTTFKELCVEYGGTGTAMIPYAMTTAALSVGFSPNSPWRPC